MIRGKFLIFLFLFCCVVTDAAQLQSNMVIQRGAEYKVTGTCRAGEKVTLLLKSNAKAIAKVNAKAGANGSYELTLPPMQAGGPYTAVLTEGRTKHVYTNILVGEVWLCSGQSNMAFKIMHLRKGKEILNDLRNKPVNHNLRIYNMDPHFYTEGYLWSEAQIDTVERFDYLIRPDWSEATPDAVYNLSSVAYYFGRALQDSLQIPVGIIANPVGGTGTEAWIDKSVLKEKFPAILEDWEDNELVQDWVRGRARENNPYSDVHPYAPGYMFEAGVRPILDIPVRGVVWYQGESNAQNIDAHNRLFTMLVENYRDAWKNDSLQFCFVQLSSHDRKQWPAFRDSQRLLAQQIPNCYMAVTTDVGDRNDVHPQRKEPVGVRLALQALRNIYHKDIVADGPEVKNIKILSDGTAVLYLNNAEGLKTSDGKAPCVFELSRADGRFFVAEAKIFNQIIELRSDSVSHPVAVRYAWQPSTESNVVNKQNLPMGTFLLNVKQQTVNLSSLVSRLSSLPALSAMYGGSIDGKLIVAGGANFPDKPAADGGKKCYYDDIYEGTVNGDNIEWKAVGKLPQRAAYGISLQGSDCIYFVDGENENGKVCSVLKLENKNGEYRISSLRKLPDSIINPLALGKDSKDAPSLRHQVTTAVLGDKVYYFGGTKLDGKDSEVYADAWSYDLKKKVFTQLASPQTAECEGITFTGGAAAPLNDEEILVCGGVNRTVFQRAVRGEYGDDYLRHNVDWYQFNRDVMIYNTRTNQWRIAAHSEKTARAGAVIISLNSQLYQTGGELKPGIRTNETTRIEIK